MSSHQKVKVIVNNKTYMVEVDDLSASPITVKVNGKPYQVNMANMKENGHADPHHKPVETTPPSPISVAVIPGSGLNVITAPMPGNILDIMVKSGDRVSKDQILCKLEAMKMQNSIRSPRDGVVVSVGVTTGQMVNYGDTLFNLE